MDLYFNKADGASLRFISENLLDRCGVLGDRSETKIITPIGRLANLDFETICHSAAKNIADRNEKVFLYWSGGLDSTLAFLVLREHVLPEQLSILYTKDSLLEYPGFFERSIKNVYASHMFTIDTMPDTTEYFCKRGVVVTGDIGDQIFGSDWFSYASSDTLQERWDNFRGGVFTVIPKVEEFLSRSVYKVTNVAEFLWWINYTCRYQYVQVRLLLDNTSSKLTENTVHFFDTPEFNDYAVSTPMDIKMPNFDVRNCKYPIRDMISKLSMDNVYAYNKPKVRSWRSALKHRIATSIDTNWVRYYD